MTQNKRLTPYRGGSGKRTDNKINPKPRPGTPEADENQKDGCRIAEAAQSLRQAILGPIHGRD